MNIKNIIGYSLLGAGAYVQKAYADSPTFAPSVGPLAVTGVESYNGDDDSIYTLLDGSFPDSSDKAYYTADSDCPPVDGVTSITEVASDINTDQTKIKTQILYQESVDNRYCWLACDDGRSTYSSSHCSSSYSFTPTSEPTLTPSWVPTPLPPSWTPTSALFTPSWAPTLTPSFTPTVIPSIGPTQVPTLAPTFAPSVGPLAVTGVESYTGDDDSVYVLLDGSFPDSSDKAYYTSSSGCPPVDGVTAITEVASDINTDQTKLKTQTLYQESADNSYCWLACDDGRSIYSSSHCSSSYSFTPTIEPTLAPSRVPTLAPSFGPSEGPTLVPTALPTTSAPTVLPTLAPSFGPSEGPTLVPTALPTTSAPTVLPTLAPSFAPTVIPSIGPAQVPTLVPTFAPSVGPLAVTGVESYTGDDDSVYVLLDGSFPDSSDKAYYTSSSGCPPVDGVTAITEVASDINTDQTKLKTQTLYQESADNSYCWLACDDGRSIYSSSHCSSSYSFTPTIEPTLAPSRVPTLAPSFGPSEGPTLVPTALPTTSAPTMLPTLVPTFAPSVGPLAVTGVESYTGDDDSVYVLLDGFFPDSSDKAYYTTSCPPVDGVTSITEVASDINTDQTKLKTQTLYQESIDNSYCWLACDDGRNTYSTGHCSSSYAFTPTSQPTVVPTWAPTAVPSLNPTAIPSTVPTLVPSFNPTVVPSTPPTVVPSNGPTVVPSTVPTFAPSSGPTTSPTNGPTEPGATNVPTRTPTLRPSVPPSTVPTQTPTLVPTKQPTVVPTIVPTVSPSLIPTQKPTVTPTTTIPTVIPTRRPSFTTTALPTGGDGAFPTVLPTNSSSFRGASKTNSETESAENGVVTAAMIIGPIMIFVLAALVVHQQCFQRREPALPGSKERNLMESVHGQGVELVNDNELESANDHGREPVSEHEIGNGRGAQLKRFGFWGGKSRGYDAVVQKAESPMQYRAPIPNAGAGE